MARGWESKSVEDQVAEAEAAKEAQAKPHLSSEQRERHERRESLRLSRANVSARLKTARNAHYRAQLEKAMEGLDKQLAALNLEEA
jgi:predicted Holliday junction resolvase-like endonuclease